MKKIQNPKKNISFFRPIIIYLMISMLTLSSPIINGKIYPNLQPESDITEKSIIVDGKLHLIRTYLSDQHTYYRLQDLLNVFNLSCEEDPYGWYITITNNYNMLRIYKGGSNTLQVNQEFTTREDITLLTYGIHDYISLRVLADAMDYTLEIKENQIIINTNNQKNIPHFNSVFGLDFPELTLDYNYGQSSTGKGPLTVDPNRLVIEKIIDAFSKTQHYFNSDDGVGHDYSGGKYRIDSFKNYQNDIIQYVNFYKEEIDAEIVTFAEVTIDTIDQYIGAWNDALKTKNYTPTYTQEINSGIKNFYDTFEKLFDNYIANFYITTKEVENAPRAYCFVPRMYINEEQVNIQNVYQFPYLKNFPSWNSNLNDIYVPLRVLCESVGAEIILNTTTKNLEVVFNGQTTEIIQKEVKNGVTLVPLSVIGTALGVNVSYHDNSIYLNGELNHKVVGQKLPVEDISKYGNSFEGRLNNEENDGLNYKKKVIVASKKDLPINIGTQIIYDITFNNKNISFPSVYANQKAKFYKNFQFNAGETFTVKTLPGRDGWTSLNLYLSCDDGLARSRNSLLYVTSQGEVLLEQKDSNGIISALYSVTSFGDQLAYNKTGTGNEYKDFVWEDINYFVFEGDEVLLAIPRSEVF